LSLYSGLAAAYRLRKSGVNVTVFEAGDRAGGKIRSNSEGGFLWDEGANTMVSALSCFRRWNMDFETLDRAIVL
jgi:protoporphyrinogen oxidase